MIADNRSLSEAKQKLLEKFLKERAKEESRTKPTILPRPAGEWTPLSFSQRQVWMHSQVASDVPIYNEPITVYRKGPLDVEVLERSLIEILRRHEIWRTTFDIVDGEPIQVVHPTPNRFSLEVTDLRRLSRAEKDTVAKSLATEDARRPFDLKCGPLVRGMIVRVDEEEYRLYMTFHQIVFDAVSAYRVFLPELGTIYEAFCAGKPSPLPDPALQYGDFAYWQQRIFSHQAWSSQLSFWRGNFSGELPILPWPNDHQRPASQSYRGRVERFRLDSDLIPPLRVFCRKEGVSSYMALVASYVALLSRYTGQEDIVIGSFSAGRKRPEIDPLIGYFVNPFALRIDLSGNPTFRELTKRAKSVVLEALANEEVPFQRVIEELHLRPDLGRNPIFQICLSQQPLLPALAPGWNLATEEVSNGGSKMDMIMVLDERPETISGPITYNSDLFDASTITRMVAHWQVLLAGALANPDSKISELPVLTDTERSQLVAESKGRQASYSENTCLHGLIEAQVAKTPEALAVEFEGTQLSYCELNERANQLAHHLLELGAGRDVLVGLFVKRSLAMVVALLGIAKAGSGYLPMDPEYPEERLGYILKQSGASIVVTEESLANRVPPFDGQTIRLDADWPAIANQSKANPAIPVRPQDLAYVLFTSGSTGKPKGVEIPHGALVNFLVSMQKEPGFTAKDTLLAVTTVSFDIAGLEIYLPLISGGTLVVASRDDAYDPLRLMKRIHDCRCSVMQATPATWRALIDAGWSGSPTLRLFCGGESLPQDLAQDLLIRCGELWNMYGPTETTIWSAIDRVKSANGPIPIGRPIANTQLHILDQNLNLVPSGVVGQLYIGGAGLARGYLHRPELTRESFIPNPFDPDARLYRTGDLARRLRDGRIECLGRVDNQVKIRGFRIELGEIEAQLARHPGVQQNVVVAREDTPGEKRIVAYVVPSPAARPGIDSLREHLHGVLPNYMVPAAFVLLESLPLTPNGKIDRKALPAPDATSADLMLSDDITPRTTTEQRLAAIFAEVLRLPKVSRNDNFFDLGGHSLMAVKLMTSIEREFGIRMPLSTLFQRASVTKLAAALGNYADKDDRWHSLVPINVLPGRPTLFLVHGAGGNVLLYRQLARVLAPDVSVYGFQSQGLDGHAVPLRRVEDMAAHYVRELREFQPSGPYYIGGYCMGGSVAYEMARLLQKEGQTAALVALLDTYNFSVVRRSNAGGGTLALLIQKLGFHLDNLKQLGGKALFGYLVEKLRMADESARGKIAARLKSMKDAVSGAVEEPGAEVFIQKINHEAGWEFLPQPFTGRITVFRPRKNYHFFCDPKMGWSDLVKHGLEIVELPVNPHAMLIDPFAARLAFELKKRIEACESEHAARTLKAKTVSAGTNR